MLNRNPTYYSRLAPSSIRYKAVDAFEAEDLPYDVHDVFKIEDEKIWANAVFSLEVCVHNILNVSFDFRIAFGEREVAVGETMGGRYSSDGQSGNVHSLHHGEAQCLKDVCVWLFLFYRLF